MSKSSFGSLAGSGSKTSSYGSGSSRQGRQSRPTYGFSYRFNFKIQYSRKKYAKTQLEKNARNLFTRKIISQNFTHTHTHLNGTQEDTPAVEGGKGGQGRRTIARYAGDGVQRLDPTRLVAVAIQLASQQIYKTPDLTGNFIQKDTFWFLDFWLVFCFVLFASASVNYAVPEDKIRKQ
jgi:hypothetical protein